MEREMERERECVCVERESMCVAARTRQRGQDIGQGVRLIFVLAHRADRQRTLYPLTIRYTRPYIGIQIYFYFIFSGNFILLVSHAA